METIVEKSPSVIREICGTRSGYEAHYRNREITCQPCRDACAIYAASRVGICPKRDPKYNAEYYVQNLEKIKVVRAEYYIKNSDITKIRASQWRLTNPERSKAIKNRYVARHPEKSRSAANRRRARVLGNGFDLHIETDVLEKWGTDCHICGEPIDMEAPRSPRKGEGWQRGLHMDHVIPISKGGPDTIENVRPAHGLCNMKKQAK